MSSGTFFEKKLPVAPFEGAAFGEREKERREGGRKGGEFASVRGSLTCVNQLGVVGLGREEQNYVVERNGTNEIEKEERLQVMKSNLLRLKDNFVSKIIGDNTFI